MAPKYVSGCVKLLLKLSGLLMFALSTSSTKQCTPKTTEREGYVIRNVGIKLCQLKCAENGQCLSIEYNIETLTCRLSRAESKKIKKKEGHVILARDHSNVPTDSCTSSMCTFGERCLQTRSGKAVCVQGEKQNEPEKSPQQVDKQETSVNSPLHEACRKGELKRVRHVLSQGSVNINSRDEKHGRTPLMVAAQEGHCRIFKFLIKNGAKMSEVDNDCKSVLHWACKGGHMGMVGCVLPQYGIVKNVLMSPLIQAAGKGKRDVFEFLMCTGSNVSQVDINGDTVLHFACIKGHVAMVKYLVSQGSVDINSRNRLGLTPLMTAVLYRHRDVFDFLVRIGANVSCVDVQGNNILHLASSFGNVDIASHILSQKLVDINARNKDGETAAMVPNLLGNVYDLLVSWGCPVK